MYDRDYIEQWFRTCRQRRQPITSPSTGLPLAQESLISLEALRKAIETYMALRPELRSERASKRSLQQAASMVQAELLEKQAINASIDDELKRLQARMDASDAERDALEIQVSLCRST